MKGWFGRKTIGYGIGPRSWQGWLATAVVLAVVIGSRFLRPDALGLPAWTRSAIVAVALAAYLALMFATTDPDA